MELKFINKFFSESHDIYKDDFRVRIDAIISYYKLNSKIPIMRININVNNPDDFLGGETKDNPKIKLSDGLLLIYSPLEKIKDKIKLWN